MVLIGESSLHRATAQFVLHYHQERNHQGLNDKIIQSEFSLTGVSKTVPNGVLADSEGVLAGSC
jgi:hypothetical protein